VHVTATLFGVFAATYCAWTNGGWWWAVAAYWGAFFGVHVAMVPVMTAGYAFERRISKMVRSVVEEELIRYDLQTYGKQLERVMRERERP
jgi:hypothetical protein